MSESITIATSLDVLRALKSVELSLNELRVLVGCLKAIAYQSELDGEDYLDEEARALQARLESLYLQSLREAGLNGHSH